MSQQTNIAAAFLRIANTIVTLNGRIGTLSSLTSTNKTSLVAALNELKGIVSGLGSGVVIDDVGTATTTVWSSTKTQTQINAAITALISGAPGAQDTLAELAAQITALAAADNSLLSFGAAQTLTVPQQLQGCTNLGIGDPAHNFVTAIDTALTGTGL
jgi:hypothetical protein